MKTISTTEILPNRAEIGAFVKKERERLGMSVYALANASDSRDHQITSIEDGTAGYTIDLLLRVLGVLGCQIVFLNQEWEPSEAIIIAKPE